VAVLRLTTSPNGLSGGSGGGGQANNPSAHWNGAAGQLVVHKAILAALAMYAGSAQLLKVIVGGGGGGAGAVGANGTRP
jgi:hypothetical protein